MQEKLIIIGFGDFINKVRIHIPATIPTINEVIEVTHRYWHFSNVEYNLTKAKRAILLYLLVPHAGNNEMGDIIPALNTYILHPFTTPILLQKLPLLSTNSTNYYPLPSPYTPLFFKNSPYK